MTLHGSALLSALAERMSEEARLQGDPEEEAKALAMADIFRIAAKNIRDSRAGELELAVLAQAKLGAHLIGEEDEP